ncbi:uncharacterized protein LOC125456619 isoform X4 [Stegostoma tigrinum]|uniref:uncharacterized protein LOC125456619 isoform X4 n=1 Tax=Stegostoma tigrinum TaxID=3053191 RepID=UPI00202B0CAE|nr:uncharacterized protein LOC125456619 isoform X4 [Stegostoma tigrinum]
MQGEMRPRYGPGRNCFKMADTLKKGGRGSRGLTLAIIPTWAGNQRQKGVGHLDEVGGFDTQRRNVHANGAGLGVLRAWFVSFRMQHLTFIYGVPAMKIILHMDCQTHYNHYEAGVIINQK